MSIEKLKQLHAEMGRVIAAMGGGVAPSVSTADVDIDDPKFGNGTVKFSPKRWTGVDFKGANWSECEPDFLDVYAEALEYSASHPKEGKEKYARYDALDAARCRAWAARLRSGGKRPARPAPPVNDFDPGDRADDGVDAIPF